MDIKRNRVVGMEAPTSNKSSHKNTKSHKLMRIITGTLLFTGTILTIALILFLATGRGSYSEERLVEQNKYQAVFLNGGQVYFGKIRDISPTNIILRDIYYLRVEQQVQPKKDTDNQVSLQKLGCELHGPEDIMVIKQDQVIFWENLKTDGKVANTIAQFQAQNPNGLQCADLEKKAEE